MGTPEPTLLWIKRLAAVLSGAPDGIWLFVASGSLHVMAFGEDGARRLLPNGGMDPDASIATLHGPEMDGGDW